MINSPEPGKIPQFPTPYVQYTCQIRNSTFSILSVSEKIFSLTGFTPEEWCSSNNVLFNIMHPGDRERVFNAYNSISARNNELSIQYRLIDKNGITRWIQDIAILTKKDENGTLELKGYLYDVSGKKKITEIVKTLKAYQFALNESAIVSLTDLEGRIIYVNENFIYYSGYTRHELIGRTHRIINSGYHPADFFSNMWKTVRTGKSWRGEVRNRAKDGTYYWVDTVITPVFNEKKEITQFLSIRNLISKQKEQEEAIKQSEEKFRDIVESTSDMIQSVDGNGLIVFVNKSWSNRLGYTAENVVGKPVINFITPERKDHWSQIFHTIRSGTEVRSAEVIFITKDGERVFCEGNINSRYENGTMVLTRGIFRDISSARKLMETLERNQGQLKEAQRLAQVGSWHYDTGLNLLEWSEEACRIFEVSDESQISYELFLSSVHPDDRDLVNEAHAEALKGEPYNLEHRLFINGKIKWVKSIIQIRFDNNHEPLIYSGSVQEITEKKLAEIEIFKHQHQLKEAQRTANIGNYEWDTVNNKVSGSDHFYQLLGLRKKKCYDFDLLFNNVHPDDRESLQKVIQKSIQSSESFSIQFRYITPDGMIKHFEAIRQSHNYQSCEKNYFAGTIQDITELKKTEQKLFNSIIEAEENERKRIAAELHDGVCQYLATSKLLLQALDTNSDQPLSSQKPILDRIFATVNESLRLTRNVSQQLVPLILYEEGLLSAIQELISTLNLVDSQRYHICTEGRPVDPEPHFSINLYRIVQEFINNSQKYSEASSIKVKILYSVNALEIHLSDNGCGFDLEQVKKQKGIGLFNMTNRICSIGGRFRFASRPGKGVSLKLYIPVSKYSSKG
ncbi:MAG TPA: PAS domain S-box protein [Chitinophagaceae bacterium]|mgnify:CR=1 FL=1|nr:PAS domain S-box protein [Chitinophagaceae bacterium]HPH31346.1 PAS domain S-box protein [Chitinophagaceae bacterium]HPN58986.1 PAS domain S-box protein [Chitinophagaceae bacterium]